MPTCVIYTRISSDDEDTRLGVARQERECRTLADTRGWTVAHVYTDNDISAADPSKGRPAYRQLLADMENGLVEAIVVWDLDRLHRRPKELEHFFEVWDASGQPELANVGGDVDLTTPQGRMVARLKGAVGAYEVEQTTRRIRAKHLELAQSGKVAGGGYRPFGYERDNITVNPVEARVVGECVDRLLHGESLRSVCRWLDGEGVRTTAGKVFQPYALRRMVTSARIAGYREHPQAGRVKAEWDGIIDIETLERIRSVIRDPNRRTWRPGPTPLILQGGLAVCGECGTRLFGAPDKRLRRHAYRCMRRPGQSGCGTVHILADLLEGWVQEQFFTGLADGLGDAQQRVSAQRPDLAELLDGITADEQQLERLGVDYANQEIPDLTFRAAVKTLQGRLAERRRTLAAWEVRDDAPPPTLEQWSTAPPEVKRRVLGRYLDAVKVHRAGLPRNRFQPERITIVWRT